MSDPDKTKMEVIISAMCIFGFFAIIGGIAYLVPPPEYLPEKRVIYIERVFMHTTKKFSVLVEKDNKFVIMEFYCDNVAFQRDVPSGERLWAEAHYKEKTEVRNYGHPQALVFHLHDLREMNGAGWDHGKHGRGMVSPVD